MKVDDVRAIFGKCRYREDAGHSYDVMRGGLVWDDEFPSSYANGWEHFRAIQILAPVIAYRASLTLGEPKKECEADWARLKSIIPDWPGFRDDRIYGDVERQLRAHKRLERKYLSEIDELLATETRNSETAK
jgi:hypothetical protein